MAHPSTCTRRSLVNLPMPSCQLFLYWARVSGGSSMVHCHARNSYSNCGGGEFDMAHWPHLDGLN